jgi:hypothetical protein
VVEFIKRRSVESTFEDKHRVTARGLLGDIKRCTKGQSVGFSYRRGCHIL